MLTVLRWIVFLPAAFIASVIAGLFMRMAGGFYSEFMAFVFCGAFSGAAFIAVGLFVAPVRSELLKWILIIITILCGVADTYDKAHGDDKLKMATGISMVLFSLIFILLPADVIAKIVKDANSRNA